MKALVVDDDAELRELIIFILRKIGGFQIESAESGDEAWQKLEQGGAEILILDLKMPGIYGTEICAKARLKDPQRKMKILIVTSYLTDNVRDMIQASGADDCMEKPFDPDAFEARVRSLSAEALRR